MGKMSLLTQQQPQATGNPIQTSKGPDTSLDQFYITEYSTGYGKQGFKPRKGIHHGTGYKSNFRPGVYYNQALDKVDNPTIGNMCAKNYNTMANDHFKPACGSDGTDRFPRQMNVLSSGFVKDVPQTVPRVRQVHNVCVDTRTRGTILPKERPMLHTLKSADPIESENGMYGPRFMSTETHTRFKGVPNQLFDCSKRSVGPKEGSGFTHAHNIEPITYRPTDVHDSRRPGWMTWRPTGISEQRVEYQPNIHSDGSGRVNRLAANAEPNTGYTREIKPVPEINSNRQPFTRLSHLHPLLRQATARKDPAEYVNLNHPQQFPSMTTAAFRGAQCMPPERTDQLRRVTHGKKEQTGYSQNNWTYVQTPETRVSLNRFQTHYGNQFVDKNKQSEEYASAHSRYGTLPQVGNGYTKSTKHHAQAQPLADRQPTRVMHGNNQ